MFRWIEGKIGFKRDKWRDGWMFGWTDGKICR